MTVSRDDPFKILLAASLGFVAGLLLAPRSGPETRERLHRQVGGAKTRMYSAGERLKRHTADTTDQAEAIVEDLKSVATE